MVPQPFSSSTAGEVERGGWLLVGQFNPACGDAE
jgi:hypothetical protein